MKKIGLLVMIAGFILLFFHIKVNEIFDKITILYALMILIGTSLFFIIDYKELRKKKDMPMYQIQYLFRFFVIMIFSIGWIVLTVIKNL